MMNHSLFFFKQFLRCTPFLLMMGATFLSAEELPKQEQEQEWSEQPLALEQKERGTKCELLLRLHNGTERLVDFFGMQRDTLQISGRKSDGTSLELLLPKQAILAAFFPGGEELDLTLSQAECPSPKSDALKNATSFFDASSPDTAQLLPTDPLPTSPPSPGILRLTSSEEGLPVWIDDEESLYRTPAEIPLDSAEHIIELRWSVEKNLWAAQRRVRIAPGKVRALHLPLKRVSPALTIRSSPSKAELWLEARPNFSAPARHRTPFQMGNLPPGRYNIYLHANGFRDTLLTQHLSLDHPTHLYVEMHPLLPEEMRAQEIKRAQRKRNIVGRSFTWSSLPALGSAVLLFALADEDYGKARELRRKIEGVVIVTGENFDRIREENRTLVRSGDRKRQAAWIALGTGGALLLSGSLLQINF